MKNRGVNRRTKFRNGMIVAKLSFSEVRVAPEVIDKLSGVINDKNIGLSMVKKIVERFDLTQEDLENLVEDSLIEEATRQRNLMSAPIKWNRDEGGTRIPHF